MGKFPFTSVCPSGEASDGDCSAASIPLFLSLLTFGQLNEENKVYLQSSISDQPLPSLLLNPTSANPSPTYQPASVNSEDFCYPRLLISNVQSILPKIDELEIVCDDNEVDLVCITESWLHSGILDSGVSLTNYLIFRNDCLTTTGGGVCIYINSKILCKRFTGYEDPDIESLWLSIRLFRLPRSISLILLAVIYHPTSCGAAENQALYNHIQSNVDTFLRNHLNGLVLITGDFNPLSTGLDEKMIKRLASLSQIINVKTRGDAILDWCLTNVKKSFFEQVQLPQLGTSNHNSILIQTRIPRLQNLDNSSIFKRDLRPSNLQRFSQWITSYDWPSILQTEDYELKYKKFHEAITNMLEKLLPIKPTRVRQSNNPWMTPSLKCSILKRQRMLHKYGKSSVTFKYWRNKAIVDVKSARTKYYSSSVSKLKHSNPSKWWKEVKSIGGLSSSNSWHHQLLSPENPTSQDLAQSINNFFTGLTSHFRPLEPDDIDTQLSVPPSFLVNIGQVYHALINLLGWI